MEIKGGGMHLEPENNCCSYLDLTQQQHQQRHKKDGERKGERAVILVICSYKQNNITNQ